MLLYRELRAHPMLKRSRSHCGQRQSPSSERYLRPWAPLRYPPPAFYSFLKATPRTTVEGIEKDLGSGMICGIGPIYARKLVRTFGEAVFDLIEQAPQRLHEVTGVGPKRAQRIVTGCAE